MPRKNSNHLWSDEVNDFSKFKNIELDEEVKEDISKVSMFYYDLLSAVNSFRTYAQNYPKFMEFILREEENEKKNEDGELKSEISNCMKTIFNFKMFLYFATKLQLVDAPHHKVNEFDIGLINCIRDNNTELMNDNWDRGIVNKINILFYETLSPVDINLMMDIYFNEFPENLRMFELIETPIKLKKIDKDEVEEVEYVQRTIRVKEGETIGYLNLPRLFNRILKSEHPYGYKVTLKAFPSMEQKNGVVSWYDNRLDKNKFNKSNNNFKVRYTAEDLFGSEILQATHTFPLTKKILESERRKKDENYDENIVIDINDSARTLDDKLVKNGYINDAKWSSERRKNIEIRKIEYISGTNIPKELLSNLYKIAIEKAESMAGMLGAGKSTFATLAINNLIDKGKIVAVLEKDVSSCVNLINTLRKIGIKATLIKGDKSDGGITHEEEYCKNVAPKYTSIAEFAKAEYENLKLLDTSTKVKKVNEIILEEPIYGATPEIINIKKYNGGKSSKSEKNNKYMLDESGISLEEIEELEKNNSSSRRTKFVNPEYLTSGVYHKYRELEDSQVIVLNYSSFLKTKAPYCLDIYERDFFTIVSKLADIVIVDEVDMAMVRFTENFIGEMYIASNEPDKNEGKYFNDYMEVTSTRVNKQDDIARNSFTRKYNKIQGNQVQIINQLLPFPHLYNYRKIINKPFTKYSLLKNFYGKYFDIDFKQIYSHPSFISFKELFAKRQTEKRENDFVRKDDTFIKLSKILSNLFKEIQLGSLDILDDKDTISEMGAEFINLFAKYSKEEQNGWNIDVKKESYRFVDLSNKENKEQIKMDIDNSEGVEGEYDNTHISDECLCEFIFLLLHSNFDINQRELTRDAFRYLTLVDKSEDIGDITGGMPLNKNKGIYPLLPKALIHESSSYRLNRNENRNIDLTMSEYNAMGNKVLLDYNTLFEGIESTPTPSVVMMSATSYSPHSTMYNNKYKPNYMIVNPNQMDMKINSRFIPIVIDNEVLYVSGQENKDTKKISLTRMIKELTKDGGLFDSQLEKLQQEYDNLPEKEKKVSKRRVIALPVSSFEMAEMIGRILDETKYSGRVRVLFKEGSKCEGEVIKKRDNYHVTKNIVEEVYKEDFDILVFVMTSIGRGYNILQSSNSYKSLIGSMFFLVRPYLVPDSINDVIHTLHGNLGLIIKNAKKKYELNQNVPHSKIYNEIIGICHKVYDELMSSGVAWNKLNSFERTAIVANFMVLIYQTIGRGLRGGTNLDVFFVDGKFIGDKTIEGILKNGVGKNYEYEPLDEKYDSFLSIMETITDEDDLIVKELYSKFGDSLKGIALKKTIEI